ncbi:MAG: mercuric transporter MerT family protein [Alphaproteobacteria bacterium]
MSENAQMVGSVVENPEDAGDKAEKGRTLLAMGGVLGAIGASACCVLPLALFSVGIGGAWIGNLTAMYPYKPIFIIFAMVFLGAGFYKTYRKQDMVCETGTYCASPKSDRLLRIALWASSILVALSLAFPYIAPLLLDD